FCSLTRITSSQVEVNGKPRSCLIFFCSSRYAEYCSSEDWSDKPLRATFILSWFRRAMASSSAVSLSESLSSCSPNKSSYNGAYDNGTVFIFSSIQGDNPVPVNKRCVYII